ncbi:C4-dicarboxylate transporter DcuC [Actomonas aquatica]|uniref:C4-dicarboxylate transporter DcuC n=1 Tax=Actomonas aquatica TaxID=2866162 RepID=A0ABZ1C6L6_9BACT|nr:C4-dicarboxylate transporter DcuC [Opitutus sp. WL0086]WRQ87280.1 C4-dicarboxylate transporter DcuC [Opitutus sp. WL0086]
MTIAALLIIATTLYFIFKQADVRMVLFAGGLALATLALQPLVVFEAFMREIGNGKTIGPICSAMGYSFVLRATGCDRAMISRLLHPLRRAGWLLLPGGCAVAFLTNIAINSQTAAAAAVGPILLPLLRAAGFPAIVAASCLLLGTSCGNLCNPGEADLVALHDASGAGMAQILGVMLPAVLAGFAVMVATFTWQERNSLQRAVTATETDEFAAIDTPRWKAFMPPLPVVMIFVLLPGFLFDHLPPPFEKGLPVPYAMLIALIVLLVLSRRDLSAVVKTFFEGMGSGFAQVISLIVTASCFIAGITAAGLTDKLVAFAAESGAWGRVAAAVFPGALAVVTGSGTGPSVAFTKAIVPALSATDLHLSLDLGALGAIAANYGRTVSPVAAVVLFVTSLAGVEIAPTFRRLALPLLAGFVVAFGVVWMVE